MIDREVLAGRVRDKMVADSWTALNTVCRPTGSNRPAQDSDAETPDVGKNHSPVAGRSETNGIELDAAAFRKEHSV